MSPLTYLKADSMESKSNLVHPGESDYSKKINYQGTKWKAQCTAKLQRIRNLIHHKLNTTKTEFQTFALKLLQLQEFDSIPTGKNKEGKDKPSHPEDPSFRSEPAFPSQVHIPTALFGFLPTWIW